MTAAVSSQTMEATIPSPPPSTPPHLPATTINLPILPDPFAESPTLIGSLYLYLTSLSTSTRAEAAKTLTSFSPQLFWSAQLTSALTFCGFASGAYLSGRHRSLQFLAENAHRLPKTMRGWYLYHKYKQHEAIHAGYKGGFKYAGRFGLIGLSYVTMESFLVSERGLGGESWVCSLTAGAVTSAVFSGFARLPPQYAKYALLFGSLSGLGIGVLQDVYALTTGHSIKDENKPRKGVGALWVPGWDWEKGLEGVGSWVSLRDAGRR
ncbi:hypothetical protein HDV05_008250 [Chytridiales sp. JEL 0842]|nr:hypothetical protein HDV05_008250 [Chytridiales sp. JEL 0842]